MLVVLTPSSRAACVQDKYFWQDRLVLRIPTVTVEVRSVINKMALSVQVKRMVISTYQAASGAGQAAMDELELQTKEVLEGKEVTKNIFPFQVSHQIS